MALTVPTILTRAAKGSTLTHAELDAALTTLRDFANTLAQVLAAALNDDGTVKDGAVSTAAKLADRIITASKRAFDDAFYFTDAGATTDKYEGVITPYPTAWPAAGKSAILLMYTTRPNQGACTIRLRSSATTWLDELEIKKGANLSLAAGDIPANSLSLLATEPTTGTVRLMGTIATGTSSGQTTNFTGLSQYSPVDTVLTAAANTNYTFAHGLNQAPSRVRTTLIASVDDSATVGYGATFEIPLDQVFDAAGGAAFTESASASQIVVTQHPAALYVRHKTTGVLTAITMANWRLKVLAEKTTSVSAVMAAETVFNANSPVCAVLEGSKVYHWSLNRDRSSSKLFALDISNGRITRQSLSARDKTPYQMQTGRMALVKRTNGDKWLLVSGDGSQGWFGVNLSASLTEHGFHSSGNSYDLPVLLKAGTGGESNPDLYAVPVGASFGNKLNALVMVRTAYAGAYGARDAAWAASTSINLSSGTIVNAAAFAKFFHNNDSPTEVPQWSSVNCLHLQWNPVRRRIYLVDDWHNYLHVFTLGGATELQAWWAAPSYGDLTYEFSIPLRGTAYGYGEDLPKGPSYHVAYDLDTGTEKYLVTNTWGYTYWGQITVAPWAE